MSGVCHTPGPWLTFENHLEIGVTAKHADVAQCSGFHIGGRTREEEIANARLIAAAPDLLAALKGCVDIMDALGAVYIAAENAIARAEGRS